MWEIAYGKARRFVASLTAEEKVNLTAGVEPSNGCSGVIPAIPRVGFPGLCVSDAGNGLVILNELDFGGNYWLLIRISGIPTMLMLGQAESMLVQGMFSLFVLYTYSSHLLTSSAGTRTWPNNGQSIWPGSTDVKVLICYWARWSVPLGV